MKFKALIGTSILAMAVATPAWAQDPAEEVERDAFGGEIVVTAQKRTERLQDVPVAVTALSGDKLEGQGGINLETAQTIIPTSPIQAATNRHICEGLRFLRISA